MCSESSLNPSLWRSVLESCGCLIRWVLVAFFRLNPAASEFFPKTHMRNNQPVGFGPQSGPSPTILPSFARMVSALRFKSGRVGRLLAAASSVGLLTGLTAQAAIYTNDFDAGLGDAVVAGTAIHMGAGGVDNSGYVSITDAVASQQGMMVLPEFTNGELVSGFKATFMVRIGGGSARAADGMAFAFSSSIDEGSTYGEEGPAGAALIVSFDTWDNNGTDTAPSIDVKVNGNDDTSIVSTTWLAGQREGGRARLGAILKDGLGNDVSLLTTGFEPVSIEVKDNVLNVFYKGIQTVKDVVVAFPPTAGRFAFGARTGGANANQWVDSLRIETYAITPGLAGFGFTPAGVSVKLNDVSGQMVDPATVSLKVDGEAVVATVSKTGDYTTAVYASPTLLASGSAHTAVVTFSYGTPAKTKTIPLSGLIPNYTALDAATVVPAAAVDKNSSGFTAYIHRARVDAGLPNNTARMEAQLRGTLLDPQTGAPFENLADDASVGADQTSLGNFRFTVPIINFDQNMADQGNFQSGNGYPENQFPGLDPNIPGGELENFSTEFTGFLELPAGVIRMGVNSDDGFAVYSGSDPRHPSARKLGEFSGGRGASDTTFFVYVPVAGVYPFRVIHEEGGGGANCEFFSFAADGSKVLVNDPNNAAAIKSYRVATYAASTPAYLAGSSPANGANTSRTPSFRVILSDSGTKVAAGTSLTLDGAAIVGTISKDAADTIITYSVTGLLPYGSAHALVVNWSDTAGTTHSDTINFNVGGGVVLKVYRDISGGGLGDLTNSEKFISNAPDEVYEVGAMEHLSIGDNYGSEMLGFFAPDHDDTYTFYLSADDGATLWLSTDESPANMVRIGNQPGWNGDREWVSGGAAAARKSPPIALQKGKRYFMYALQKEGGGGDSLSVAFTDLTTKTTIKNGDAAIVKQMQPFTGAGFSSAPKSATVNEGLSYSASARVVSAEAGAISYQWMRNGVAIAGATDPNYSIPAVAFPGDNGAKFTVVATLGAITVTSAEAVLTVVDDSAAPAVASAYASSRRTVVVKFNEPIASGADVAANYSVNGGVGAATAATASGSSAVLTVGADLVVGNTYTVTVNGTKDFAGNTTAAAKATFTVTFASGFVLFERWDGIGGTAVANLTDDAKYQGAPDGSGYLSVIDYVPNLDNYGVKISGYITPKTEGDYRFFIRSDDASQMWLSTDDTAANASMIAEELGCCGGFEQPGATETSEPQHLLAGTRYYFHAFMKEGGGGDNVEVAWREEADTTAPGSLPNLAGSVLGTYIDPTGRGVNIVTQPAPASVVEGRSGTVSALAVPVPANGGLSYQWQYKPLGAPEFINIDGATGASYTSGPLPLGLNGALVRVVASTIGGISTTSAEVLLTVLKDSSAPIGRIHTVSGNGGVQIRVDFDEDLDTISALSPGSYSISKGTITGVTQAGSRGVILQTTGLKVGDSFVLTITGVKDLFNNALAGSINGKVSTLSWVEIGGRQWKATAPDVIQINENDFDVFSGGNGFWSNYDEGTFVYEEITGDFNREVRIEYQDASSHWARCGLMVRVATDEGTTRAEATEIVDGVPGPKAMSQYQQIFVDPTTKWDGSGANNGHEANRRTEPGAQTGSSQNNFGGTPPPYPNAWLRMERKGDDLNYYKGINGSDWDFVGSIKISGPETAFNPEMPAKVLVGMIYCPEIGNNGAAGQKTYMAKFREYSSGVIVGTPKDPATLSVSTADGKINVSWTNGGTLQSSPTVGAGAVWTDVAGGSPASITPSGATLFLRVKN